MRRQDLAVAAEIADRQQLLGVVVAHVHDVRGARRVVVGDQHGVAVGRTLEHGVHADGAAGAGAVLHHDLLADGLRHAFADGARDEIDGAAGRQRHDEADRTVRKCALRAQDGRCQPAAESEAGGRGIL